MQPSRATRVEQRPLSVLTDFCELAVLASRDGAHAAAFDMMIDACVEALRKDGDLEHLRSAALRIASACGRLPERDLRLVKGGANG
jgi:hypothetical protein